MSFRVSSASRRPVALPPRRMVSTLHVRGLETTGAVGDRLVQSSTGQEECVGGPSTSTSRIGESLSGASGSAFWSLTTVRAPRHANSLESIPACSCWRLRRPRKRRDRIAPLLARAVPPARSTNFRWESRFASNREVSVRLDKVMVTLALGIVGGVIQGLSCRCFDAPIIRQHALCTSPRSPVSTLFTRPMRICDRGRPHLL